MYIPKESDIPLDSVTYDPRLASSGKESEPRGGQEISDIEALKVVLLGEGLRAAEAIAVIGDYQNFVLRNRAILELMGV